MEERGYWSFNKSDIMKSIRIIKMKIIFISLLQLILYLNIYSQDLSLYRSYKFKKVGVSKFGYIDSKGEIVIRCKYSSAKIFQEGLACVTIKKGKVGYIDKNGLLKIRFIYGDGKNFNNGRAIVSKWIRKYGYCAGVIDKTGKTIIDFIYDFSSIKEYNSFYVARPKKDVQQCILLDSIGHILTKNKYTNIYEFQNGLARVVEFYNDLYGCINIKGKEVIPCKYECISNFDNGIAIFRIIAKNGEVKEGFIDTLGNELMRYDNIRPYSNDFANVRLNDKYGFVERSGKLIIPIIYNAANDFEGGKAVFKQNSIWNYMDNKECILPFKFLKFSEGIAHFKFGDTFYFVDSAGKELFTGNYDTVYDFHEGYAIVGDRYYVPGITRKTYTSTMNTYYEKRVWDSPVSSYVIKIPHKDTYTYTSPGRAPYSYYKYGFINNKGVLVIPIKYLDALDFNDKKAKVKTTWDWIFIDVMGDTASNTANIFNVNVDYGSFTDPRDKQIYKTIRIGNQVWMAQNLNYTTEKGSWIYDNDSSNASIYGRLYNWKTANTTCPTGWHLPSYQEWKILVDYLGGEIAGEKLKSQAYWKLHKHDVKNSSGFSALPGGDQGFGKYSYNLGESCYFWSSTGCDWERGRAWAYIMGFYRANVVQSHPSKMHGFSVRCIKD